MSKYVILLPIIIVLFGCASSRKHSVVLTSEGHYKVVATSRDKHRPAVTTRKVGMNYCEQQNKTMVEVSSNTVYQGLLDEKTNEVVKRGTTVMAVLGSMEGASVLAAGSSETDYVTTLLFKCQ